MVSQVHIFVESVAFLSRRPRLYTPTGTLQEVVAYFAGCCALCRLPDDNTPEILWRFSKWLSERHGEQATVSPAEFCAVLSRLSPEPIKALWHEFELFADEHLGVPRGTCPKKIMLGPCF